MSKKSLTHRGYLGSIEFDLENNCLFGKVLFIKDLVAYQGQTPDELNDNFCAGIDDYIETCKEVGKEPEQPFSGTFNVRIDSNMHRKLAYKSAKDGVSLNVSVSNAIEKYLANTSTPEVVLHKHVSYSYTKEQPQKLFRVQPTLRAIN